MLALTVLVIFGILYDLMKIYPNYLINDVDIKGIYLFEKKLFGVIYKNELLTPNEFLAQHRSLSADLTTGLFYLNWMPVPIAFGIYLYFKNKMLFLNFSFLFLLVNIIGFCIYYIHPAAPPWYVEKYGFQLNTQTPGDVAALAAFDTFWGVPVFETIYAKNSNIFAALPSLHAAYPVVLLYITLLLKKYHLAVLASIFMFGIWFSAIYSFHHYVVDVIAGIICAIMGILIYKKVQEISYYRNFLIKYSRIIS